MKAEPPVWFVVCGTCGGDKEVCSVTGKEVQWCAENVPAAEFEHHETDPCPTCQPPDQPGCICGDLGLANEMYRKHCPVHAQPTTAEPLAREAYRESQRQWCDHKPNSSVCEDCAVKPITAALDAVRREKNAEFHGWLKQAMYVPVEQVDEARQQAFRECADRTRVVVSERAPEFAALVILEDEFRKLAGEES